MRRKFQCHWVWVFALWAIALSGCTSVGEYFGNGLKVGPNYCPATAEASAHWIDANDVRIRSHAADLSRWWGVFNDPVLDDLMNDAYKQNLPLKEAAARVLQSRAQLGIAVGGLFPQTQDLTGSYKREGSPMLSSQPSLGNRFFDNWNVGASLAWELDFWGEYRRMVLGAKAQVDYSVEDYDSVLVSLLGDVANYYTQARVLQERIALARSNAALQRGILEITMARFKAGSVSELDVDQAQTTLSQTESQIPLYELNLRQVENHICTLLSIPQCDLEQRLGIRPIPMTPIDVAVGIPAELLTRRPDVRRAERACAVQSEQIGIAQAQLYPHISISGNLGYSATKLSSLFTSNAFNGSVGPSFQWNVLNYGRLAQNINLQDARFQELLLAYRNTVITANEEAENGLVSFVQSQEQTRALLDSVIAADKALSIVLNQYRVGTVDFNRVATIEQTLVVQQDVYTQAKGNIPLGLIQVYRALGGGWQIRLAPQASQLPPPPATPGPFDKPLPTLPKLDEPGKTTVRPANGANGELLPTPPEKPAQ